jgi:heat shock protein HtpX
VFQPYFYYAAVLLTVWFLCTKLLLRSGSFLGHRARSFLLLVPLGVPAAAVVTSYAVDFVKNLATAQVAVRSDAFVQTPAAYFTYVQPAPGFLDMSPLMFTALIGLAALAGGAVVFLSMMLFGGWVARKIFGVVLMEGEDYTELQERVRLTSAKLGIRMPKVGLVEDLRPNAFSIGRGGDATIVFSLGILKVLDGDEMEAVISHELSHIKDGDLTFKAFTSALVAISFFNPLAYLSASAAQKEREMLADERGAGVIGRPEALVSALVKVGNALRAFPPDGRLMRLAVATFVASSFEHRSEALSSHPTIEVRAWNVLDLRARRILPRRRLAAALVVSSLILVGGVVASIYLVDVQAQMLQVFLPKAPLAFSYASQHPPAHLSMLVEHDGGPTPYLRSVYIHGCGGNSSLGAARTAPGFLPHEISHI